jgi:hypothetical protein
MFGVLVVGSFHAPQEAFTAGFRLAMLTAAGLALAGAATSAVTIERRSRG